MSLGLLAILKGKMVHRLALASVLVMSCIRPAADAPVKDAGDDLPFVWATSVFPPNLDPATALEHPRRFDIFEPLTALDDAGRSVEPWLATQWELLASDHWRLRLRPGVTFHDGSPLTSQDVKFSLERYLRPASKSPVAAKLATIRETVAVADDIVDIRTRGPDPILLRRLAQAPIVPSVYVARVGDSEFGQRPIGTGAYRIVQFVPDDRAVLEATPHHYRFRPAVRRVIVRNVPQPVARLNGLKIGELDYVNDLGVEAAESLRDRFDIQVQPNALVSFLRFDASPQQPYSDRRVRQALNYAIDKEAIARFVYKGQAAPLAGQLATPGVTGFSDAVKAYRFDQTAAREMLIDAGYPAFRTVLEARIAHQESADLLVFLQSQLSEVGVQASLDVMRDSLTGRDASLLPRIRAPLSFLELSARPLLDSEQFFRTIRQIEAQSGKSADAFDVDRALASVAAEPDAARREVALQRLAEAVVVEAPYLFLVSTPIAHIASRRYAPLRIRAADDILLSAIVRANGAP